MTFIELHDGLWYNTEDGTPWSSKIKDYKVLVESKNEKGYQLVTIDRKKKRWHRIVYEYFNGEIASGFIVDHINNNINDNRIENLQLLTQKENTRKSRKIQKKTSQYKGVSWRKDIEKWRSTITVDAHQIHLGYFKEEILAARAYNDAACKYFENPLLNVIL